MVVSGSDRPRALRAPNAGGATNLQVAIDVGGDAALVDIARRVKDLVTLVEVGHRWGFELARGAAAWDLENELQRGGPEVLNRLFLREKWDRLSRRRHGLLREYFEFGWPSADPEWIVLRDLRAQSLLGQAATVRRLEYSNPIELVLAGSGLLIGGVIVAARLVRDWSVTRRTNEAVAREAEAEARMTEDRARLYSWMVDEARRGASPIPIVDLVQMVTPAEVKALSRLSQDPVTLELPRGSE